MVVCRVYTVTVDVLGCGLKVEVVVSSSSEYGEGVTTIVVVKELTAVLELNSPLP